MLSIFNQRGLLAIAILVASSSALSKDISYDFLEGGYASTSTDSDVGGDDLDFDSFGIAGSSSSTKNMAITFSLDTTALDKPSGVKLETLSVSVGLTAHTLITNSTSLFGNFSLLSAEVTDAAGDESDFGNITTIGLRYAATNSIELDVAFSHTRIFDGITNTLGGGVRYYVDEKFSLGIGYAVVDNSDVNSQSILLNARIDM